MRKWLLFCVIIESALIIRVSTAEAEVPAHLFKTSDHQGRKTVPESDEKDLMADDTFSVGYAKYIFGGLFGGGYPPIGLSHGYGHGIVGYGLPYGHGFGGYGGGIGGGFFGHHHHGFHHHHYGGGFYPSFGFHGGAHFG